MSARWIQPWWCLILIAPLFAQPSSEPPLTDPSLMNRADDPRMRDGAPFAEQRREMRRRIDTSLSGIESLLRRQKPVAIDLADQAATVPPASDADAEPYRALLNQMRSRAGSPSVAGYANVRQFIDQLTAEDRRDCDKLLSALMEARDALARTDCTEARTQMDAAKQEMDVAQAAMEQELRDREQAEADAQLARRNAQRAEAALNQAQADLAAADQALADAANAVLDIIKQDLSDGRSELVEMSTQPPPAAQSDQWQAIPMRRGPTIYMRTGQLTTAQYQSAVARIGRAAYSADNSLAALKAFRAAQQAQAQARQNLAAAQRQAAAARAAYDLADSNAHHRAPADLDYKPAAQAFEAATAAYQDCVRRKQALADAVKQLDAALAECKAHKAVADAQSAMGAADAALRDAADALAAAKAALAAAQQAIGNRTGAEVAALLRQLQAAVTRAQANYNKARANRDAAGRTYQQAADALENGDYETAAKRAGEATGQASTVPVDADEVKDAADQIVAGSAQAQRDHDNWQADQERKRMAAEHARRQREQQQYKDMLAAFAQWLAQNKDVINDEDRGQFEEMLEDLRKQRDRERSGVSAVDVLADPGYLADLAQTYFAQAAERLGNMLNLAAGIFYNWVKAEAEGAVKRIAKGHDLDLIWARLQSRNLRAGESIVIQGVGVDGRPSPTSYFVYKKPNGDMLVFKISATEGLELLGELPKGYAPGRG